MATVRGIRGYTDFSFSASNDVSVSVSCSNIQRILS